MTDYTNGSFVLPVETTEAKGYASVHANLYREENGLDFTGSFFVYLLHPTMGSTEFTLEPVNYGKGFRKNGGAVWIENEIIEEILKEIKIRFNRPGATVNAASKDESKGDKNAQAHE